LAGAVIGVRGQWTKLSYDFFVGAPISKPEGYRTAKDHLRLQSLNASF
jgi:hemolysin activation/secretion protein